MDLMNEAAMIDEVTLIHWDTWDDQILLETRPPSCQLLTATPRKWKWPKRVKRKQAQFLARCDKCQKPYRSRRGLKEHMHMHVLKDVASRTPDCDAIVAFCLDSSMPILEVMMQSPTVGLWGTEYKEYIATIQKKTQYPQWMSLVREIGDSMVVVLKNKNFLLPSATHEILLKRVNYMLATPATRELLLDKLMDIKVCLEEIAWLFLTEFVHTLVDRIIGMIFKMLRGAPATRSSPDSTIRAADKYLTPEEQEYVHKISASCIRGFLRAVLQHPRSTKWRHIEIVIRNCLIESSTVMAVRGRYNAWTALLSHGVQIPLCKKALDFFLNLAVLLQSMELHSCCRVHGSVLSRVFNTPSLINQWDNIVGTVISEPESINFMTSVVKSFTNTYGSMIMRKNLHLLKGMSLIRCL